MRFVLQQPHPPLRQPEGEAEPFDLAGPPAVLPPVPSAARACCCPAAPAFQVVLPAGADGRYGTEILLCRHHLRTSRGRLDSLRAAVYDASGCPVRTPGRPGEDG
jgi:hypothetical protein